MADLERLHEAVAKLDTRISDAQRNFAERLDTFNAKLEELQAKFASETPIQTSAAELAAEINAAVDEYQALISAAADVLIEKANSSPAEPEVTNPIVEPPEATQLPAN